MREQRRGEEERKRETINYENKIKIRKKREKGESDTSD